MQKIVISALFFSCLMSVGVMASNDAEFDGNTQVVSTVASANDVIQKVDINTADVTALVSLHGLAEKKAQAIVDYRKAHGSFQSVNDLTKVKGIGDKLVAKLQAKNPDRIVCRSDA